MVKLSPDGARVRIQIDESFTAEQLSELLITLGQHRAQMTPAVPIAMPDRTKQHLHIVDPSILLAPDGDGFFFAIRTGGFGWLTFDIPAEKASAIRDLIAATLGPAKRPDEGRGAPEH